MNKSNWECFRFKAWFVHLLVESVLGSELQRQRIGFISSQLGGGGEERESLGGYLQGDRQTMKGTLPSLHYSFSYVSVV